MDMIRAENVCVSFGKLNVLKGVTLSVKPQEVVCIIGASGAGKSTFLRALNHLEHINNGSIYIEDKLLTQHENGVRKLKISSKERREILLEVGMVFQRFNLFPHKTALENLMVAPMHVLGKSKEEAKTKAIELLERVGLGDKLDAYPANLSGGQQQRVSIARALALNPDFIICDEPVSALDVSIRAQVLNLLKKFQRERGLTYLFIAHDLLVVQHISDRIAVMHQGYIVELGNAEEIYGNPLHPYTKSLLTAIPQPDPKTKNDRKKVPYVKTVDYDECRWVEFKNKHYVLVDDKMEKDILESYK